MRLISLISIDSTNTHAQRLIKDGLSENSLIYCEEQTKGRGQRGNNWLSRPGDGIYCSYVFFQENVLVSSQFVFNMSMAVAVADFIASKIDKEVKIKWPNDVLVDHKKIAGLLIENSIKGDQIGVSIVGIGLNLNQEWGNQVFETPSTSLIMETNQHTNYEEAVFELAKFVKLAKEEFDKGDYQSIITKYHKYLYKHQETSIFLIDEKMVEGKLHGVNEDGSASILIDNQKNNFYHPQARIIVNRS